MSAFDIAGAVVATPLAVLFWRAVVFDSDLDGDGLVIGVFLAIALSLWSVFCIARLCGATL